MKKLTREQRKLKRWDAVLDTLTVLLALCAILLMMFVFSNIGKAAPAEPVPPVADNLLVTPAPTEPTTVPPEVTVAVEQMPVEFPENPDEQSLIDEALVDDGYYSDLIPLSYDLQDTLRWACEVQGIPFCVGLGLIEHESRFNPNAVSKAGCYGLCQLNPKYFPADLDPHENIVMGIQYLGYLLNRYNGDLPAALRAYNRGHDDGRRGYSNTVLSYAEAWRQVLDKEGVKP